MRVPLAHRSPTEMTSAFVHALWEGDGLDWLVGATAEDFIWIALAEEESCLDRAQAQEVYLARRDSFRGFKIVEECFEETVPSGPLRVVAGKIELEDDYQDEAPCMHTEYVTAVLHWEEDCREFVHLHTSISKPLRK
ncbi:MAG TPA: hypothetical protein K8U80_03055 [Collinsella ihuae]|uniref:SnoaL-like domain-containing protein n=1 Tax=Collinsella ihumii TaxID=1720204 RepID=A0A921LQU5_9ACTN|nr:hypothetical protein [Collinsella ihumii]